MPELPEVETVRRGFDARVVGRRIDDVEVLGTRTVRRTSPDAVVNGLTGVTIVEARRRGKYLLCPLDSGDTLLVHLRMTGRLLLSRPGALRPSHTHVVFHLAADLRRGVGCQELWFIDPRTFGEVVVFDPDHAAVEVPDVVALGLDPLVDDWGPDELAAMLRGRTTPLKAFLLDQHRIAGIGNIYADEVLHAAKLHPDTPAGALRRTDVRRLYDQLLRILTAAVGAGGSTLRDAQYVDLMGSDGWYQDEHLVYARAGQRCLTCGRGIIRRIVRAGRTTCFCPVCQRVREIPDRRRSAR